MGIVVYRVKTQGNQRCSLCHHITKYLYQVIIGGNPYQFCSGLHAQQASENYQRNKHITPEAPQEEIVEDGGFDIGD